MHRAGHLSGTSCNRRSRPSSCSIHTQQAFSVVPCTYRSKRNTRRRRTFFVRGTGFQLARGDQFLPAALALPTGAAALAALALAALALAALTTVEAGSTGSFTLRAVVYWQSYTRNQYRCRCRSRVWDCYTSIRNVCFCPLVQSTFKSFNTLLYFFTCY